MNEHIRKLNEAIEPLKQQIVHHPLYNAIKGKEDLNIFMRFHIYAVWDFMSLLKSLQRSLTCVSIPWFPKGNADTRYLINEIVTGEESDIDMNGVRKSHFELYLDAMEQSGTDTSEITQFLEQLQNGAAIPAALNTAGTHAAAQDFVRFTFDVINSNKDHIQAAVFTFGREDLIPDMFYSIVGDIHKHFPESISIFKYYLERHIEVDGDHHSHLALEMTASLCGEDSDKWAEATTATIKALEMRLRLWNGAYEEILRQQ